LPLKSHRFSKDMTVMQGNLEMFCISLFASPSLVNGTVMNLHETSETT